MRAATITASLTKCSPDDTIKFSHSSETITILPLTPSYLAIPFDTLLFFLLCDNTGESKNDQMEYLSSILKAVFF